MAGPLARVRSPAMGLQDRGPPPLGREGHVVIADADELVPPKPIVRRGEWEHVGQRSVTQLNQGQVKPVVHGQEPDPRRPGFAGARHRHVERDLLVLVDSLKGVAAGQEKGPPRLREDDRAAGAVRGDADNGIGRRGGPGGNGNYGQQDCQAKPSNSPHDSSLLSTARPEAFSRFGLPQPQRARATRPVAAKH